MMSNRQELILKKFLWDLFMTTHLGFCAYIVILNHYFLAVFRSWYFERPYFSPVQRQQQYIRVSMVNHAVVIRRITTKKSLHARIIEQKKSKSATFVDVLKVFAYYHLIWSVVQLWREKIKLNYQIKWFLSWQNIFIKLVKIVHLVSLLILIRYKY